MMVPVLESYDVAETDRSTPVRFTTTQPTQALLMLNSDFINQQAGLLAARLKKEAGDNITKQVERGLYLTTQRRPDAKEIRRGIELIQALKAEDGISADVALKYFCLAALNFNEFVYLD
jgi:hypothetical protein